MNHAHGFQTSAPRQSAHRVKTKLRPATDQATPWRAEIPGPLWNGTRRVKPIQIKAYCRLLAREFRPHQIILFGSYAYGSPTKDSDVDILVVMPHRSGPQRQSVAIRQRCAAPFPLDLLVWTPAYARKRQAWNDSFTREIFGRGKRLYEASHA
jgi:uncharacterized protein